MGGGGRRLAGAVAAMVAALAFAGPAVARGRGHCERTLVANVAILDQPLMFNRLGAQNINGVIYALQRDIIDLHSGLPLTAGGEAVPGYVALRPDKRPRPLVLRVAEGECLQVNFKNLLRPEANPFHPILDRFGVIFRGAINDQVAERMAGFHPQGMELVEDINDDSSFVGRNESSLIAPGEAKTYRFRAVKEGAFLVTNPAATFGGEGLSGNHTIGGFAVVNVEPKGARFFRSQVTEEELRLVKQNGRTPQGHPVVDYFGKYPDDCPHGVWCKEGKAGLPVLAMVTDDLEIVHSDLNAVIVGPNPDGTFPPDTYPLESVGKRNPAYPNRLEPFREFTVAFHDEVAAVQAFPGFYNDPVFSHTLVGVRDAFMINYGAGGIGSEILASRLGVGPMHDCLSCNYEEFFLSSFTVGDPAMVVDVPANVGLEDLRPGQKPRPDQVGPKATRAFYPDDPSNVHHAYTNDFVKFRNLHVGREQHVFHLHNHQWLFNPNDDNSNYIDAQGLGPGSGYTYEMVFGGAGNRNKSVGDAIFHCHFYPHFAAGMWELFRVHDVFEAGTRLAATGGDGFYDYHTEPFALQDGTPAKNARALPDGEIVAGTPIPALIPLPGKAMAPMPGKVKVVENPNRTRASSFHALSPGKKVPTGSLAKVVERDVNPGFPFFVAGIEDTVGQRPPTPPLDMLSEEQARDLANGNNPLFRGRSELVNLAGGFDGGLPRHTLDGYAAGGVAESFETRLDFSKFLLRAKPVYFPEEGTDVEQTAMAFHAEPGHPSTAIGLDGSRRPAVFETNGQLPVPSGVYADPCRDDAGNPIQRGVPPQFFDGVGGLGFTGEVEFDSHHPRTYKAAVVQIDAVFNKVGYHYPQQRVVTLWEDVDDLRAKKVPPEPFVIRFNTFDCGKYLHTNLVPEAFELDDYQVRTPTDVIGQHIHLPKWDLTTTDGAANGWNYEDGTLSPGAVRERVEAINDFNRSAKRRVKTLDGRTKLKAEPHPFFGNGPGNDWVGARTTIQRWFFDPVTNVGNRDRGLGIIFTHDHFGPSTHQQIGLYGSVLTEPAGSRWKHNETGKPLYTRDDGGPTTWQAVILTGDDDGDGRDDSFREFWFMASDFQHAYEKGVYVGAGPDGRPNQRLEPDRNTFRYAIAPSARVQANPVFPDLIVHDDECPGGQPRPCPEAISADDVGMLVVNYRNETVAHRVFDPEARGPDGRKGRQTEGLAGDLAHALQSRRDRAIKQLNTRLGDTPYPALTKDIDPGDPFTPIMRTYAGDRVRFRFQMGGQEHEFQTSIQGVKWLQSGSAFGSAPNSGWRNAQGMAISEQFTFDAPIVPFMYGGVSPEKEVDFAYTVNTAQDGWWSGVWGIFRSYNRPRLDLTRLPTTDVPLKARNAGEYHDACPPYSPVRKYDITAVLANEALPNEFDVTIVPADDSATQHVGALPDRNGGTLVFNPRDTPLSNGKQGPLHDPTGILYVHTADLDSRGKLKAGKRVEPLVLRAAAGECLEVMVRNRLPEKMPDLANLTNLIGVVNRDRHGPNGDVHTFNNNLIRPSGYVGLHAQLVSYDITQSGGLVVGQNPSGPPLVRPGGQSKFRFYAGDVSLSPPRGRTAKHREIVTTPIEFGGTNLGNADKIKQGQKGLGGALVILPEYVRWKEDENRRSAATVEGPEGRFRDFAVVTHKQMSHRYRDGTAVENVAPEGGNLATADSVDAGQMAINYGTEPLWFRFGLAPNVPVGNQGPISLGGVPDAHRAYSNQLAGGMDPVTPVFSVDAGKEFRMHLLQPHGSVRSSTMTVHGHLWQRDPYVCPESANLGLPGRCEPNEVASQALGINPQAFYLGGQESYQPMTHFDLLFPSAGGANRVKGDYLFRDVQGNGNVSGLWGIVRVQD
jgi:hypothetical protein